MALINCPECGKEISDKASSCPTCGCPIGNMVNSNTKKSKHIIIVLLVILFAFFGGIIFVWSSVNNNFPSFQKEQMTFSKDSKAIEKVDKSVVKIICYNYFGEEMATGSGFVALDKNTVVTNFHVIEGAYSVVVQISEEKVIQAEYVLCSSKEKDLAILKTKVDLDVAPLKLGNSEEISKGQEVVAIGSPLGLVNTVSTGVISGQQKEKWGEVIQFTAPISNGSSGGALFDSKGTVIGVTYASYNDGQNLNLAIPIEYVIELYGEKQEEKYTEFAKEYFPELELFSKYDKVYQVTFQDLRNNPYKYDKKYIVLYAYVSSIGDYAGLSLTDDEEYISGDSQFDYDCLNEMSWSKCPYLMGITTPISKGYGCETTVGNIAMVIGQFHYNEQSGATMWVEYFR